MSLRPIRCLSMARALSGAVLLLTLTPGCASTPQGTGGSGPVIVDPSQPPPIDLKAGREEAARVAARVWAVASGVRDVGSQLRFTLWSDQGALTLLGFVAENRGGRPGRPATDAEGTQRAMMTALEAAMKHPAREVSLTLRRTESAWQVESTDFIQSFRPTHARTVPGGPGALSSRLSASDVASHLQARLKSVQVPTDGTVSVDVQARVRNGHLVGLDVTPSRVILSGRGDKPRAVAPHVASEVAHLILLYAPCMGERSIRLGLRLSHRGTAQLATGGVEETEVSHSLPTADTGVVAR